MQLGIGVNHETVTIDGFQIFTPPPGGGQPVFDNRGGLLALRGANIGRFTQDHFSVVPEVNLNVGYQLTPALRAFVGYNFLYWNNVVRPGTEIDTVIDATRVPNFLPPGLMVPPLNPPRPMVRFQQTDFWAKASILGWSSSGKQRSGSGVSGQGSGVRGQESEVRGQNSDLIISLQ